MRSMDKVNHCNGIQGDKQRDQSHRSTSAEKSLGINAYSRESDCPPIEAEGRREERQEA